MSIAPLIGSGLAASISSSSPSSPENYPEFVLAQAPLHYWRLTDTSDDGSSAVSLTNVNTVPFSGRPPLVLDDDSGGSASFSGTVTTPGHFSVDAVDGLTASTFHCVVQPDLLKSKHILMNIEDPAATASDGMGIELTDNGAGALRPRVYRWTGSGTRIATGAPGVTITPNAPVIIDVVFGTDGSLKVYLDSIEVGMTFNAVAAPVSWPAFASSTLRLGAYKDGVAGPLSGLMSEVAIFDRVLDAGAISVISEGHKVTQAVYLANISAGTISGTGSIDPAAHATTHPKSGLTAIENTDPDAFITVDDGVWDYDASGEDDGAIEFTGSISINGETSSIVTISATVDNEIALVSPIVPSVATFLENDDEDIPGSGTIRYVRVGGSGTGGSTEGSAGNIQTTINASSPGDTVVALEGFYNLRNGLTFPTGTSGNPIRLMAKPGNTVVLSCAEDFALARTPNNGVWTQSGLSGDDIAKKIWKSVSRMGSAGENTRVYGTWIEFNEPHFLLAYKSLAALRSAYVAANTNADGTNSYDTPGAWMEDGFIYIRMQIPHPDKFSPNSAWDAREWPGFPEARSSGDFVYPVTENPNDYVIHLYRRQTTRAFVMSGASADGFIHIGSGINTLGYHQVINRGHHISFGRGLDIYWRNWSIPPAVDAIHHVFIDRRRMTCGSKLHASRSCWKFDGPYEADRGAWIEFTGGDDGEDVGNAYNFYMKDCTISYNHELVVGKPVMFRWRNCLLKNTVDDGIQGNPRTNRCEIGYCFLLNHGIGGGNGGSGTATAGVLGQWYFHHSIMDLRGLHNLNWGADTNPVKGWLNHSSVGSVPRKCYNLTVLWGPDTEENTSTGLQHNDNRNNTSAVPHEVFNNIIIRHDVQRYEPTRNAFGGLGYSDLFQGQHDAVQAKLKYDGTSLEMWDYNLYYRDLPGVGGSFGGMEEGLIIVKTQQTGSEQHMASLAAWRSHAGFNTSKNTYSPGFEANGTDTKPVLPSLDDFPDSRFDYRPSATAAVTVAKTSSLSGANWWGSNPTWGADSINGKSLPWTINGFGLAPSNYKGALDPNGSTMPVGVQNP